MARFEKTSCSQCGREFGPGDHGFSHCDHHQNRARMFEGLVAVVRYRRKDDGIRWHTMAAFDSKSIADKYAAECSSDDRPWEYDAINVPSEEQVPSIYRR